MKKDKKKLKFKDIYNKVNHNPYCQVTNIVKKYTIKSNVKNFFKNSWKALLIILIISIAIFIYTFWNNLIIVLYCLLLMLFLLIAAIFYNSYKITLSSESLKFKINFQETIIPYDKLANIYFARGKTTFFFIPFYYYNLEITYLSDKDKISVYSFPTFMLNKKEIIKFFSCFEVEAYKDEQEELEEKNKDRKNFYKAMGISIGILLIVLFIVAIFAYIFMN